MQVSILPARRGVSWLVEGFVIFRSKPALLIFLVLGYLLTTTVVSAIPLIGRLTSFLLIPAFSVSLMNACRMIDHKNIVPPQILFSGFHRNLQTLLTLGAIYIPATLAILGLSALFDDGLLFRMLALGEAPTREMLEKTSIQASAQLSAVLFIPVFLAYWFAPVLAAWHDMSAGKSLFFSLVACLRNWRVFLVYALSVGIINLIVPSLVDGLLGGGSRALQMAVAVMITLVLVPTVYASFYVSYRDVFTDMQNAH